MYVTYIKNMDRNRFYYDDLSKHIDIQDVRDNTDRPWDKYGLSMNTGVTVYDVDNLHLPNASSIWDWNWDLLSQYIDIQEVRDNTDRIWNKYYLSQNPGITIYDVDRLHIPNSIDEWGWGDTLSQWIDIQEVRDNPYRRWSKYGLSMNPSITIYDIDNLYLPNSIGDWNWMRLSEHINMNQVRLYPNRTWNRKGLSMNSGITLFDVDNLPLFNSTGNWDWKRLSEYVHINEILNNMDRDWHIDRVYANPTVTIDAIIGLESPNEDDVELDWIAKTIDMQQVRSHPDRYWYRGNVGMNKGVTIDDIILV